MESSEHAREWQRIAGKSATLLRSRIEIVALLQSIVDGGQPLLSEHQVHDHLFVAALHRVSDAGSFIEVAFSDNKVANAEVFAAGAVAFGASHLRGYIRFLACHPVVELQPRPLIRFDLPEVLYIEQRRLNKRIRVVPEAGLHCLADDGGYLSFDAKVVDIGLAGLGVLVHDEAINLAPGTRLKRCRIDLPAGRVATVDIEVIQSTGIVLLDGSAARRVSCRFIGGPEALDELLRVFVLDLERRFGDAVAPDGAAAVP